ncbi:uncharacterized protein SPAPADRAFT_58911 [Spathaspora passalidarum NRRL Y-27907]|uniref:Vacuolar protein sorting-associated protein 62 n=1 Tax=Spathaspora passalidarum (strain NRRL Y-27907 / 11-Y1) TaxID=619300 RepID=G3AEC5_SPAPN|nr:uncharacterized protein SPAPADRAFT_58911 [Spathaspora passalidarum NRRL Y-27907]EGW35713.1 hypothetical protein SPAPADRAFT_58911 [Spathaspora passalidarum NRRL Y-27907]
MLYPIFWLITLGTCIPLSSFNVQETTNYILNAINDPQKEIQIENILKNPLVYKDYPPIVSLPKKDQRTLKDGEIPDYVLKYSPLVHLYSEERYLPYDIQKFVTNFHVTYKNGTIIPGTEEDMTLEKLSKLPKHSEIFLTSNSDFDKNPEWITGFKNKPNLINGEIKDAPAVLITVDKGNGWVDSYWFYFYSFNLGPFVMGQGPYGNHVGDWEHSLVRFYKGEPIIVWMSAHGGGGAFYYKNLEKYSLDEKHPIIFSARGTHANYPSVGQYPHDLPYGILSDFTDRGPLWNPSKNYLGYTYDGKHVFPTTNHSNPKQAGREWQYGNWLSYTGHWGDQQLPDDDPRQVYSFIGGYKYIDGPMGPLMKNLLRLKPCERAKWWNFWSGCNVRQNIKWGVGIESEGYNCGNLFINVRPTWLKSGLQRVTWGGGFCYIIDLIYG